MPRLGSNALALEDSVSDMETCCENPSHACWAEARKGTTRTQVHAGSLARADLRQQSILYGMYGKSFQEGVGNHMLAFAHMPCQSRTASLCTSRQ